MNEPNKFPTRQSGRSIRIAITDTPRLCAAPTGRFSLITLNPPDSREWLLISRYSIIFHATHLQVAHPVRVRSLGARIDVMFRRCLSLFVALRGRKWLQAHFEAFIRQSTPPQTLHNALLHRSRPQHQPPNILQARCLLR